MLSVSVCVYVCVCACVSVCVCVCVRAYMAELKSTPAVINDSDDDGERHYIECCHSIT